MMFCILNCLQTNLESLPYMDCKMVFISVYSWDWTSSSTRVLSTEGREGDGGIVGSADCVADCVASCALVFLGVAKAMATVTGADGSSMLLGRDMGSIVGGFGMRAMSGFVNF